MSEGDPSDELRNQAARGARLVTLGQLVRVLANLLGTVVLSRLLIPEDFGLMAIVISIAAFAELVRDFGLTTAAARASEITQAQKANLFWINAGLGLLLSAVVILCASLIAAAFGEPKLSQMLVFTAPVFLLNGASAQFRAEINRRLEFGRLAVVETVPAVIGLIVAILWALVSPGEMALVAQQLSLAVSGLVIAVALARWLPSLPSRGAQMKHLLSYGGGLFGTQFVAYFARNADNLSIGAVWGAGPLGLYSRAFQLLMMPINQLAAPLTRVAVPVLSRVSSDRGALNAMLHTILRVNVLVLGTGFVFATALAPQLVTIVFGDQWRAMVPIFQVLAVGGIFKALNQANFWAFLATDNTSAQFRFYLWSQPLVVLAMLAGLPWGALGVAIGHSVGYGLNWFLSTWWSSRYCGTDAPAALAVVVRSWAILLFPVGVISWTASMIPSLWAAPMTGLVGTIMWILIASRLSSTVRNTIASMLRRPARRRGTDD